MTSGISRETKVIDGILYQKCTKCGEWLEASRDNFYFRKDKNCLLSNCKKCFRSEHNIRKNNNLEHYRAYNREYHKRSYVREKRLQWESENRDKIKSEKIKWNESNTEYIKEYIKKYNKENKKIIYKRIYKYQNSRASFKTYKDQLTIEEDPKEGKNGKLLVKCAYCGRYFYPTNREVRHRIEGLSDNTGSEKRLYCSDGCKAACPIYWTSKFPKGYKKSSSREVDPLIRQMCLEADDYTCQLCYRTIEEVELHAHHEKLVRQNPILANDLDNVITLCKKCHKKVHSKKGCKYHELRCKN